MYYCRVFFIADQRIKSIYIISEKFLAFLGLKPQVMMLKELRSLANRPDIEQISETVDSGYYPAFI